MQKSDNDDNLCKENKNTQGQIFTELPIIDKKFKNYKAQNYQNKFTLNELCFAFRNYTASELKIYYSQKTIRLFISALATTKLIILRGTSGKGKTSLAYAWGKFLKHETINAKVQYQWNDITDFLGYFNEFINKYCETESLKTIYTANYTDDIYTILLDNMNIARAEFYFNEILSILDKTNKDERKVKIISDEYKSNANKINNGNLEIPNNIWYIGTVDTDNRLTVMITEKVYSRSMKVDINTRERAFKPISTNPMNINYTYLNNLFIAANNENSISANILEKIKLINEYFEKNIGIKIDNKIIEQMKKFVSVYVACGGKEIEGLDYFLSKKVLEQLENIEESKIESQIDSIVEFINKIFGKNKLKECNKYLLNFKENLKD